jgi:hypothetical protein
MRDACQVPGKNKDIQQDMPDKNSESPNTP